MTSKIVNSFHTKDLSRPLDMLVDVPEEILWRANFNSPRSVETYDHAIRQFSEFIGIYSSDEFRKIQTAHVIAFRNHLIDTGFKPATVNNRLSAISSLFNHLIEQQIISENPVAGIKRLRAEYQKVKSKKLSRSDARNVLDAPDPNTLQGVRDRAVLATFFFTGCRVSELCHLKIQDYFQEDGYWVLDFKTKGGKRNRVSVPPELNARIIAYLKSTNHGQQTHKPLFLSIKPNKELDPNRHLTRHNFAKLWKKYSNQCGIFGTTPHSARTTFISSAIANDCPIQKVQKTVNHAHITTTQMYDKTEHHYKDSASFAVWY